MSSCLTCLNSVTCTSCNYYTYLNGASCASCISYCRDCSDGTSCSVCYGSYLLNSLTNTCVYSCSSGTYNNSGVSCLSCNSSIINCQTCSNGVSCSTCMASYFLNSSSCSNCMVNCQDCSSATICTTCSSPYMWDPTSLTCVASCPTGTFPNVAVCTICNNSLNNCLACSDASTCTSCLSSFVVSSSNICICPLGTYNSTATSCVSCNISNCQGCSGSTVCTLCIAPYFVSSGSCILDCSSLSYCSTCTYDYSTPAYLCTQCITNFEVYGLSQLCRPICGDGFLVFGMEACDDGNSDSYDGCSDTCTIEPYYSCTNISNQPSNCTLISLSMNPLFNMKSSKSNEFTMSYSLEPSFLPIYSRVAWTQAFTVNGFDGTVSAATYDSAQNRLLVTVQYSQDIDGSDLGLSVNPALIGNSFSTIVPSTVSCTSSTENNLKLDFYESNAYALAAVVQALSIVTAIVSLLLFVAGYFGAKLIALECVATVQLSSLLLFTLQKVNPTFHALHFLGISLGRTYSQSAYSYQPQTMTPQFKGQTVSYFSAVDYGLSILTVFIPLIVGAVLYAILQTSLRKKMPSTDMWNFAVGEYTFYGLAFCSYSAFATLAIDIRFCDNSSVCFIGIAMSAVLAIAIIGYCVYFTERPQFLGEFKKRFKTMNICQHFYSFAMIERMVNAFLIVFLTSVSLQAVGPLIVLSIELTFIIYRRPYVLREWIRPQVVKLLMIVIVLLFLAAKVAPTSFALYIPLLILGCLLICEIYSCMELGKELKERPKNNKQKEIGKKFTFEEAQLIQLKQFEAKIMPNYDLSKTVMTGMIPDVHRAVNIKQLWKQYDKPYSISVNMVRQIIQKDVNSRARIFQEQQAENQQQNQI